MKAVSFLDELKNAGIDSFKIEGRMKTEYYVAHVVNAYRRAIDKTAPMELIERELEAVSHRPYNSGFYYGNLVHNHFNDGLYHQDCTFAGVALEDAKDGKVLIEQRNFFKKGDQLELVTPLSLGTSFIVEAIETENGEQLETACHPQQILYIACGDTEVKCGDILRVRKENE